MEHMNIIKQTKDLPIKPFKSLPIGSLFKLDADSCIWYMKTEELLEVDTNYLICNAVTWSGELKAIYPEVEVYCLGKIMTSIYSNDSIMIDDLDLALDLY